MSKLNYCINLLRRTDLNQIFVFIFLLTVGLEDANANINKRLDEIIVPTSSNKSNLEFDENVQEPKNLEFSTSSLNFSGASGTSIASQSVTLNASEGTPEITLSDDPDASSWLILPTNPSLGQLNFGVRNNLPPGTYSTTVFAIDNPDLGYGNAQISITLEVTEATQGPTITTNVDEFIFETTTNNQGNQAETKQLVITNTGTSTLTIEGMDITGEFASQFDPIANTNVNILPGTSQSFDITYAPDLSNTNLGYQNAQLEIISNGPNTTIGLYALKKSGFENLSEPPLQDVVNTLGIGINVGWTTLASNTSPELMGEEVFVQSWERTSTNPVQITPVGRYSPAELLPFGWYTNNDGEVQVNEVGVLAGGLANAQRLNPPLSSGGVTFNPGTAEFGFYVYSNSFNRYNYTQDGLNTDDGPAHRSRVFPMKDRAGNAIPNSYLVTFEDATNGDYQDYMFVISNVTAVELEPVISLNQDEFTADVITSGNATVTEEFTLTNTGNAPLVDITAEITGTAPQAFTFNNIPERIEIGASATFSINFNPSNTGPQFANLTISGTNATDATIALNGLGKLGNGGDQEPSLQWVLDTYLGEGTINVGDTNTATNLIDLPEGTTYNSLLGDEIDVQTFQKANEQPVVLEVLSVFGPEDTNPVVAFGWYPEGSINQAEELAQITNANGNGQRLNPQVEGTLQFNPGAQTFGFYSRWPFFNDRIVASEDNLNTFQGAIPNHVRVYRLPGEENAYIIATEEHISGYDYQDIVFIARNIQPTEVENSSWDINFSDAATPAPAGYLKDSGLPYGGRGAGNRYGWLNADNDSPADLSQNARNRNISGVSVLQNTLIHMQYGSFSNSSSNYLPDAKWEIEIPNGTYNVSIGVGDPTVDEQANQTPFHYITAENTPLIEGYSPSGPQGASSRFRTASGIIVVEDGRLTLSPEGGFNTKINYVNISATDQELPYFTNVNPSSRATNVAIRDFQINVGVFVPEGYELDKNTTAGNVELYEITPSGEEILLPSNANDTGGGDAITLTPSNRLKEFTSYVFKIENIEANRLNDLNDRLTFVPFESTFTTGALEDNPTPSRDLSGIEFTKVLGGEGLGEGTIDQMFSSLVIGPDGKLYASTLGDFQSDGTIQRWDIEADGTLSNLEILRPQLEGAPHPESGARDNNDRLIIGLVFDPASTADNLIAYVTHSKAAVTNGPAWDGIISRLSGPNLSTVQDLVIHLPRSLKDHLTNSMVFDDAGQMYIAQGSNTAGGSPDVAWGLREERLLAGAVLKLDLSKLPSTLPLDAYTTNDIDVINSAPSNNIKMSNGTYNPYASNSPLTIFATGIRNTYDLLWHTNGWLYMPTNGTAGNNINTPITPSTADFKLARRIDGRTSISSAPKIRGGETQKDWLFKTQGGTYHGHPNPYRGEFVLNHGGRPYSGLPGQTEASYIDVEKYPRGLGPDINYAQPAYDFGMNKSPNGVIEYKSEAFGGRLKGLIMVTRFSGQDDLIVMNPTQSGDIDEVYFDIPGLSGFDDPLDIIEDVSTGNIYVSEYDRDNDGIRRLTLLRANDPNLQGPRITSNTNELIFEASINNQGSNTAAREVTITNNGIADLNISNIAVTGTFASQFSTIEPAAPQTLAPGEDLVVRVTYAPSLDANDLGYQNARLVITSNATSNADYTISLNALKKQGFEGDAEPSLQTIVNTLGYGIDVGFTGLNADIDALSLGDEVQSQEWIQATDEPVTITPVGRYSSSEALPFGWYNTSGNLTRNEVGVLDEGLENAQRLYPPLANGTDSFDPDGSLFGIYTYSRSSDRYNYTQDSLNVGGIAHRVRSYPVKDRNGNIVENRYLITFEEANNPDYQDYMFLMDNVLPRNSGQFTLTFNEEELNYFNLPGNNPENQTVTLSANGFIEAAAVTLTASEPWVTLPENFSFGEPIVVELNTENLQAGNYSATLQAQAPGYTTASLRINLSIVNNLDYAYQFNFQDPERKEQSPQGYTDDYGYPYNGQPTGMGDLTYGWVQPNTLTPASATENARNRNETGEYEVLRGTFNTIGAPDNNYPLRDWVVNIPNGTYAVNLSVGDPDYIDSNHILDVNGKTAISFDAENNPDNIFFAENTILVEVTDGLLRLSLGEGGVNAKINYIRIAPLDAPLTPPQITATFEGTSNDLNSYRGNVAISLAAQASNSGGSISRLEYALDGSDLTAYNTALEVNTPGTHVLEVQAEDNEGIVVQNTYYFTVAPASNALINVENMTKIPGTDIGFPADDYYTFYWIENPGQAVTHDTNVLRINNTGTANLTVSDIEISNTNNYSYELLGDAAGDTLPLTIAPGDYRDLRIRIIGRTTNGQNRIFIENITITSNADNNTEDVSTLHGGFAPQPESGANYVSDEINAQEVFDAFGFRTNMQSIVNDQGTITPPNNTPTRPSSNAPSEENVIAGYHGDLILADSFVQADPSKPVRLLQLSAFHGYTPANAKFVRTNSGSIVGGVNMTHTRPYYQTLLPKNSSGQISNDVANNISGPFRIAVENYLNTGGNDINGTNPAVLGVRVYKVVDRDGKVVPNEYIVLQDYVQNGCGAGSANCDWNDNTIYITNIRPEAQPSIEKIAPYYAYVTESFSYAVDNSFIKGYAGNKLSYEAIPTSGMSIPGWLDFDPATGTFSGIPPENAQDSYTFEITATDLNGIELSEEFTLFTLKRGEPNNFLLRINSGGPTLDYDGKEFIADRYFTDGAGYTSNRVQLPELYKTERSENATFGYSIPVPDDYKYAVTLHFAEIYWGATGGGPGGVGKRIFDVSIQDSLILDNYDITADVGAENEAVKTYEIIVTDGIMNIQFSSLAEDGGVDFPMVSAIEIEPLERINSAPTAVANATPESGPSPLEVAFSASESTDDVAIVSYEWATGGTILSEEEDFTYTFEEAGIKTVMLTVADAEGLTDSTTVTINVDTGGPNSAPNAVITADATEGTAPLRVAFNANQSTDDTAVTSYEWKIDGEVVSNESGFNYIFEEPANYNVQLTVSDAQGLSDTENLIIRVKSITGNSAPTAIATADITTGEIPLTVNFTGSNSTDDAGIVSYNWTLRGETISTDADFEYTFEQVANHNVSLTVTDEEGLTDTVNLVISTSGEDGNTAPTAVASANISRGSIPLSVTFTGENSSDDQEITSYEWSIDGTVVANEANFTNLFEQAGNYDVSLTVTDASGLTDTATITITVLSESGNEAPRAIVEATPREGDAPLEVSFTGSNSTDDNQIVSYEWRLNGNVISNAPDFEYTFEEDGTYQVSLTVTDEEGLTNTETVAIIVGGGEPFAVIIYPNPATTSLTIAMENAPAKVKNIYIIDARGRIVHTHRPSIEQEETVYDIQLPILAAGMYIISIEDMDGNTYVERLIIKNY